MKTQYIKINEVGDTFYYSDKEMNILHREDGPTIEWADGSKSWHLNGECHREDGPAIEWPNGSKEWYLNGHPHREDGPAIERADGYKSWYLNGRPHREDGPAIEWPNGSKEWWLNGERLTEKEFNKRKEPSSCCNGKIVEIDGKKYKLIEQ